MRGQLPTFEVSAESIVTGRRPIKLYLHEIFPDDSTFQKNGISWKEDYVNDNLQSAVGMSIVAEFISEERDIPYGHGLTDVVDNMPLMEDATVVGHTEKAYIDTIEVNGEQKRVLVAEGTLDEMRYPKFIAWVKENMETSSVSGSVEIVGKEENGRRIIYDGGWKDEGRVPQIYDYSGYAILSIPPADDAAIVVELNAKKSEEEEDSMTEEMKKEMEQMMSAVVSEQNSKWEQYYAQLTEKEAEIATLNAAIAEKEAEIAKIQADYASAEAAAVAREAEIAEANARIEAMEAEAKKLKDDAAKNELNAALASFSDEEKAVAQGDIDAFMENPDSVEINSIVGTICTEMIRKSREQKDEPDIDIFAGIDDIGDSDEEDESIY